MRVGPLTSGLALALCVGACSSEVKLQTVPLAEQPAAAEPIVVPTPPPPARADLIADPPSRLERPAWVDGQWRWRGRRWLWEPGEWVDLRPNQVYSPPYVVRRSDGVLLWYPGQLRLLGAEAAPSARASARTSAPPAISSEPTPP